MIKIIVFIWAVFCLIAASVKMYDMHFSIGKYSGADNFFVPYLDRTFCMMLFATPVLFEALIIAPRRNNYTQDYLPFRNYWINKLSIRTRLNIALLSNAIIFIMLIDFGFAAYSFYNGWEDGFSEAMFMTGVHNGAVFMLCGGTILLALLYLSATIYSLKTERNIPS